MTLDNYKKAKLGLRDRFKSMDNESFKKLACENMAKAFLEANKHDRGGISNKYFEEKSKKAIDTYYKWADEVDKLNFVSDIEEKFKNINTESYINKSLFLKNKIINIRGGYMNKPDEFGKYTYRINTYKSEEAYEEMENDNEIEFYLDSKENNLSRKTEELYEIIK